MKKTILTVVALVAFFVAAGAKKAPEQMMSWEEATAKADKVLAKLSLEEKI